MLVKDYSPTQFDCSISIFLHDQEHWRVCPCTHTRDSEILEESNFHTALKLLGNEGPDVHVHRFGHWGPGWYEVIIVNPANKDLMTILDDIESLLASYPALDEEDFSRREYQAKEEYWESFGYEELQDITINYLANTFGIEGVTEIALESLRSKLETIANYDLINSEYYFETNHALFCLQKLGLAETLLAIDSYPTLSQANFELIPQPELIKLYQNNVTLYDLADSDTPLKYPDWLIAKFSTTQISLNL